MSESTPDGALSEEERTRGNQRERARANARKIKEQRKREQLAQYAANRAATEAIIVQTSAQNHLRYPLLKRRPPREQA